MTSDDLDTSKQTASNQWEVSVNTSMTQLLPVNPNRVSVVISPPLHDTLTVSIRPAGSSNNGINMSVNSTPLVLSLTTHGALVCQSFSGIKTTATETIVCWETLITDN